ncbi:HEPN domain-containing protein [Fulvivirgaceae bacterium LMO-SS25]
MDKNEKWSGVWWIPNAKLTSLNGLLIYKKGKTLKLKINGEFEKSPFGERKNELVNIILGEDKKRNKITLVNCYAVKSYGANNFLDKYNKNIVVEYFVQFILVGHHILNRNGLQFNNIKFSIDKLNSWFHRSEFTINYKIQDTSVNINRVQEKDVFLQLSENEQLKIESRVNFLAKEEKYFEYKVRQDTFIQFISSIDLSINDIVSKIQIFNNFLILLSSSNAKPTKVYVTSDFLLKKKIQQPVQIQLYFLDDSIINKQKKFGYLNFFLTHNKISEEFPEVIKNWFNQYSQYSDPLGLFFDQISYKQKFSYNTFLNQMQSLESLHAFKIEKLKGENDRLKAIPDFEFKRKIAEIMQKLSKEDKDWLKGSSVDCSNRIYLQKRLEDILSKTSNPTMNRFIGDVEVFIKQIKQSRNYYTHRKDRQSHVLHGAKLRWVSMKLTLVYSYWVLIDLQIDKSKLENALKDFIYHNYNFVPEGTIE